MKKLKIWMLALLLASSFPTFSSHINQERISDNLYILSGKDYGTNIGLISTEEGVVLIDPMPGDKYLAELNNIIQSVYDNTNTFILNTHTHSDHAGGNDFFIKQGGILIDGEFDLEGITRIEVKSHSSNDFVYYYEKSNVIFVGDVFDSSWHPTFYAGGVEGFVNAVNTILKLGNDKSIIIPGHGTLATKSDLSEFRKNTVEWVKIIRNAHQSGKTVENIMKDKQVKGILERFNVSNQSPFLPKKAFKRFIERTITVIEKETATGM